MPDDDTAPPPEAKRTVTVTIDGRAIEAEPGALVIAAAQDHGTYIPRFCWHERMSSVGMCRMCLVDIDTGRGAALQPACMISVSEGMVVSTDSERVAKAQEGVLEFLLANHPLDCPVCDKGGECPLQDQAFSHGPGESRYVEEKRHYAKPIPISDLVLLDRERCILCDRCTRFAAEVAGDPLIHFVDRGNATQIMTFPNEPFASYFSGNTVQICPVGALTATPYRFKARPWDLEQAESTCTTCAVGCRIVVQSSRNEILRYQGVDSDPVNWGWLCDKGRFGFQAANSEDRLRHPLVRHGDALAEASWAAALAEASQLLQDALDNGGPSSIGVLGGAHGTNEDAYAWAKLAKAVLGTDNVDCQLGDGLPPEVLYTLPRATIDEAAAATTVVLLGPDLKEELPVLYLRLRDAAEHRRVRILELSPRRSGLTPYTWQSFRHRAGEQAAAVRALLGRGDPGVLGVAAGELDGVREQLGKGGVVVVAGRANLAESPSFAVEALVALRDGLPGVRFLPTLRRANVHGALDAGLAPGLLPGRVGARAAPEALRGAWASWPEKPGLDAFGILDAAAHGRLRVLVLLGADPLADFPDRDLARRALAGATVIAVDTFLNPSNAGATVVLPAAAADEREGTTTNIEGRATTVAQKVTPAGTSRPEWIIAAELAAALGHDLGVGSVADLRAELAAVSAVHAALTDEAVKAGRDGVLLSGGGEGLELVAESRPLPKTSAYDYRLVVSRELYDAGVTVAKSAALRGLARQAGLHLHPLDVDRLGVRAGASVRVTSSRTTVTLEVRPDAGVPRGAAWVAHHQPSLPIGDLVDASLPVTDLRVETL